MVVTDEMFINTVKIGLSDDFTLTHQPNRIEIMKCVTNRIALEYFEYEPYGFKPAWFLKLKEKGKVFEYKKSGQGEILNGKEWRKFTTGDKIFIDEFQQIGKVDSNLSTSYFKPLDENRDSCATFNEKIEDAKYKFMENLK